MTNYWTWRKHTEESKKKMSEAQKERLASPDAKINMDWLKLWRWWNKWKKVWPHTQERLDKYGLKKWNKMWLWKKHKQESKEKMRQARLWKQSYWKDRKMTEEQKSKLDLTGLKMGRLVNKWKHLERIMGPKNHNWKWWITPENKRIRTSLEIKLWRQACFERDVFTCKKCGGKWIYLNVHHIENFSEYPELRLAIDNWITLCKKCHLLFHNIYSRKNNTRKQLETFII